MTIDHKTVDALKASGHFFASGALAASLGFSRDSYGCHFGMRSDRDAAITSFVAGWNACEGIAG